MTILDVLIPEAEIERLAPSRARILYALYGAHPEPIKVGTLYRAGGTGAPKRMSELNNDFLFERGLMVVARYAGKNENGTPIWDYSLQRIHGARVEETGQIVLPMPQSP